MMAATPRPMVWPRAERGGGLPRATGAAAAPPPAGTALPLDPATLAAALAPELGRLFALQVQPSASAGVPARPVTVARLPLARGQAEPETRGAAGPATWLQLAVDAGTAGSALSRLYGAPGSVADGEPALPAGVAGTAAWLAFARLLAMALARALDGLGLPPAGAPAVEGRPVPAEPLPGAIDMALDLGGTRLGLMLAAEGGAAPTEPDRAPAAGDGFGARLRAQVQAVTLPVTLRLAGWRLPVGRVAALRAGDVLPIEAPRHLDVMVGGRRIARLPADGFVDRGVPPREDA